MGGGVGTKISSLPYSIEAPGFYYVTRNLTAPAGKDGITIKADNVTLDLMGFKVSGPGWVKTAIVLNGTRKDVEIRNGSLTNWDSCIQGESENMNIRVINVRVQAWDYGVRLSGDGHLVKGCHALNTIHAFNIKSGTVCGCTVVGDLNSQYGIWVEGGGVVSGNYVYHTTADPGVGIHVTSGVVSNNVVSLCKKGINGGDTIIINHNSVGLCYTSSISASGGSIIGNSINAEAVGIDMSGAAWPNLLTQNSVTGFGTSFKTGSHSVNVANTNAGF